MQSNVRRLVSASVSKMLGEYDHRVKISPEGKFSIIYGPNGVGKTKFLEAIHAVSHLRGYTISRLPINSVTLEYADGSTLTATRSNAVSQAEETEETETKVRFLLETPGYDPLAWDFVDIELPPFVQRRFKRISDDQWIDENQGEMVSLAELKARFGRLSKHDKEFPNPPTRMTDFLAELPTFLIETQRLRNDHLRTHARPTRDRPAKENERYNSRIVEQSNKIRSLLNEAQTENSRITQRKDRDFPNRVLRNVRESPTLDPEIVRERFEEQESFRRRLGNIVEIESQVPLALPEGVLEPWALSLLELYLEDSDSKLQPFEDLLHRIELLEDIINSRLLNKKIKVSDKVGLEVFDARTKRGIGLDDLSSGEQHEIILMIDLLFHVPSGAVVLIDEPEISLHVGWQLAFIPDVKRIADLVDFRFIVATHSPQIINDQWDLAVRLGPEGAK